MQVPQNNSNNAMENQAFGYMNLGNVNMNLVENTNNVSNPNVKSI